jgi:hypothetical protein
MARVLVGKRPKPQRQSNGNRSSSYAASEVAHPQAQRHTFGHGHHGTANATMARVLVGKHPKPQRQSNGNRSGSYTASEVAHP